MTERSLFPDTGSAHPSSTPFASDPRFPQQGQNYSTSYPSRAPSAVPTTINTSRTLPPLGVQQGQYYPQASISSHSMANPHARSPTATFNPYDTTSPLAYYNDPRALPPSVSSMGYQQSDVHIPRRPSMSVDRTVPSRLSSHGHVGVPYSRIPPAMGQAYEPEPEIAVKKKRKRAGKVFRAFIIISVC